MLAKLDYNVVVVPMGMKRRNTKRLKKCLRCFIYAQMGSACVATIAGMPCASACSTLASLCILTRN